jgi:hypothetical protein
MIVLKNGSELSVQACPVNRSYRKYAQGVVIRLTLLRT